MLGLSFIHKGHHLFGNLCRITTTNRRSWNLIAPRPGEDGDWAFFVQLEYRSVDGRGPGDVWDVGTGYLFGNASALSGHGPAFIETEAGFFFRIACVLHFSLGTVAFDHVQASRRDCIRADTLMPAIVTLSPQLLRCGNTSGKSNLLCHLH
jgi:hypothetical protein